MSPLQGLPALASPLLAMLASPCLPVLALPLLAMTCVDCAMFALLLFALPLLGGAVRPRVNKV